jgi:hypothetical protein
MSVEQRMELKKHFPLQFHEFTTKVAPRSLVKWNGDGVVLNDTPKMLDIIRKHFGGKGTYKSLIRRLYSYGWKKK